MPWRDQFNKLKNEFNTMMGDRPPQQQQQYYQQQQYPPQQYHQQPYQQQQYPPPPPPPQQGQYPQGPGPSGHGGPPPIPPHPPRIIWQPRFQTDIPITQEWDAKLGNGPDGWGNQELQHYTADQNNAFQ